MKAPTCRQCGAEGEVAILDDLGPDGATRRFWRCPRCLAYLGAIISHLSRKVTESNDEVNELKDAEPDR